MVELEDEELRGLPLIEHPAARAWGRLRPGGAAPEGLTRLKRRRLSKSEVYRLAGVGPGGAAVIAKWCPPEQGRVEHAAYAKLLPRLPLPRLGYHGCVEEADGSWLFIEEALGGKYQPELDDHRRLAGRWLGVLHGAAARLPAAASLSDRGPSHYRQLLDRICDTVTTNLDNPALGEGDRAMLRSLVAVFELAAARWKEVVRLCAGMPRTLIHGDLDQKNVRVRPGPAGPELLAFDWEVAGWGPPAADLARPPMKGNVDLTAYWETVRDYWPGVGLAAVHRWAIVGTLFWSLAGADWDAPKLATHCVDKAIWRLPVYRDALAGAARILGWED